MLPKVLATFLANTPRATTRVAPTDGGTNIGNANADTLDEAMLRPSVGATLVVARNLANDSPDHQPETTTHGRATNAHGIATTQRATTRVAPTDGGTDIANANANTHRATTRVAPTDGGTDIDIDNADGNTQRVPTRVNPTDGGTDTHNADVNTRNETMARPSVGATLVVARNLANESPDHQTESTTHGRATTAHGIATTQRATTRVAPTDGGTDIANANANTHRATTRVAPTDGGTDIHNADVNTRNETMARPSVGAVGRGRVVPEAPACVSRLAESFGKLRSVLPVWQSRSRGSGVRFPFGNAVLEAREQLFAMLFTRKSCSRALTTSDPVANSGSRALTTSDPVANSAS